MQRAGGDGSTSCTRSRLVAPATRPYATPQSTVACSDYPLNANGDCPICGKRKLNVRKKPHGPGRWVPCWVVSSGHVRAASEPRQAFEVSGSLAARVPLKVPVDDRGFIAFNDQSLALAATRNNVNKPEVLKLLNEKLSRAVTHLAELR